MLDSILEKLTAIRPYAPKTAVVLILVSAPFLFAPTALLNRLGLDDIASSSRVYLGLAFLLSCSVLLAEVLFWAWHKVVEKLQTRTYRVNLQKHLSNLSKDEKELLRDFLEEDLSTIHAPMSGGVANFLQGKGIISRSSNLGMPGSGDYFPYSIQPVALAILKKNPKLLE